VALSVHYDVRRDLRRDTDNLANPAGARFTVLTLAPEVAYGLPGRVSLRLRAPIHWKEFEEPGAGFRARKQGLGDLEFLASYDVMRASGVPTRRWDLAASAGLALPTGEHEVQPFVGQAAPTPLQLGGGTWDPLVGLGARCHLGDLSLDGTATGRLALMENSDRYRPPSLLEVGLGAAFRAAAGRVSLGLHAEWSRLGRVGVAGVEAPNTGRDALYAVPAASLRLSDLLGLNLTARVPLYLRVKATQLAEEALLGARLVYRAGPLWGKAGP
jgi:hypothetical protein